MKTKSLHPLRLAAACAALAAALFCPTAWAQGQESTAEMNAKLKAAMRQFSFMNGNWRGTAWTLDPSGKRHEVVQTERVGPFLDGVVQVVEGKGFDADGTVVFNAFAVISHDPVKKAWTLRSWAQGRSGEFPLVPTADGFIWTTPGGPGAIVRYTAVIQGDSWREVGEYVVEGRAPRQVFEMNLKRIGPGNWPAEGAVPMK